MVFRCGNLYVLKVFQISVRRLERREACLIISERPLKTAKRNPVQKNEQKRRNKTSFTLGCGLLFPTRREDLKGDGHSCRSPFFIVLQGSIYYKVLDRRLKTEGYTLFLFPLSLQPLAFSLLLEKFYDRNF